MLRTRLLPLFAVAALALACGPEQPATSDAGNGGGDDVDGGRPGEGEGSASGEGEGEGSSAAEGEGEGGGPVDAGFVEPQPVGDPDVDNTNNDVVDSDCDGIPDEDEFGDVWPGGGKTDPADFDTDGDGLPDGVEAGRTAAVDARCTYTSIDADPTTKTNPTLVDSDADCIADNAEDANRNGRVDPGETDPTAIDTDDDGLSDGEEAGCNGVVAGGGTGTSPLDPDSDGDGLPDGLEVELGLDPLVADQNRNGIPDGTDVNAGVDPAGGTFGVDSDGDGIPDDVEIRNGTNPNARDSDGDGLDDSDEDLDADGIIDPGESDPNSGDTDCDGLGDLAEVGARTDATDNDSDGDGLSDGLELGKVAFADPTCTGTFVPDADPATTTDPNARDTDGDGINDGVEDLDRNGALAAPAPGFAQETNPSSADTDGDAICDGAVAVVPVCVVGEDLNGDSLTLGSESDPRVPDLDTDGDGITDLREVLNGTDPDLADTDGDGLCDGPGASPTSSCVLGEDQNGDGVLDAGETDPLDVDSDCDAVSDADEINGRTNPVDADSDRDGLTDGVELGKTTVVAGRTSCIPANVRLDANPSTTTNSDPLRRDTDGDGTADGLEDRNHDGDIAGPAVSPRETFPIDPDSDDDGLCDGPLSSTGCVAGEDFDTDGLVDPGESDPRLPDIDADHDGLLVGIEQALGTSDSNADTDGDGLCDGAIAVPASGAFAGCAAGENVDRDTVVDVLETDPLVPDSDCDAVKDGEERSLGTNPLSKNSDGDGIEDGVELGKTARLTCKQGAVAAVLDSDAATRTNPKSTDSDLDGIPDGIEDLDKNGALAAAVASPGPNAPQETNAASADTDGDGLCDGPTSAPGSACVGGEDFNADGTLDAGETDPRFRNTDDDKDGLRLPKDPNDAKADTDGDGLCDGAIAVTGPVAGNTSASCVAGEDVNRDGLVGATETDPTKSDSDCDAVSDGEERTLGTNPLNKNSDSDTVEDGVELGKTQAQANALTCRAGAVAARIDADPSTKTNPRSADSDLDGLADDFEDTNKDGALAAAAGSPGPAVVQETDPSKADTDADGLCDGAIAVTGPTTFNTSATCRAGEDLNRDGTLDAGETNPRQQNIDADQDGLFANIETLLGTSDTKADTDGDGLCDGAIDVAGPVGATNTSASCVRGEDINKNGSRDSATETDATKNDTDCDALADGAERTAGTNALFKDSDGDGLGDGLELGKSSALTCPAGAVAAQLDVEPASTTNPLQVDTDNDGLNDGIEDANKNGRNDGKANLPANETNPNNPDTDNDGLCDGPKPATQASCSGGEDANKNGVKEANETDPNIADVDSDGDGLTDPQEDKNNNGVVDSGETDKTRADTDGDGASDGDEVLRMNTNALSVDTDCDGLTDPTEDVNRNGVVDAGETNPRDSDTDDDGLLDGLERGTTCTVPSQTAATCLVAGNAQGICRVDLNPATTTSATIADTDGDGIVDGAEDANQNGRVDPGELNPGVADATNADVNACSTANLRQITLLTRSNAEADLVLAVPTLNPAFSTTTLTRNGTTVGAMVLDTTKQVSGVAMKASLTGTTAADKLQGATGTIRAALAAQGTVNTITVQSFTSWDANGSTNNAAKALITWTDAQAADNTAKSMNDIVAAVLGGTVAGTLATGGVSDTGQMTLQVEVLVRSNNSTLVVMAMAQSTRVNADEVALFRVDDNANGSALAQFGDTTGTQCDRFVVQANQKVDYLMLIDNSGSMSNEQAAVASAATALGTQLDASTIDWRVGVITSDVDGLANTTSLSTATTTSVTNRSVTVNVSACDDSGTGGTVVVTTAAAHGLQIGDAIVLAGVDGAGTTYNGSYTVADVTSTTTFRTAEVDPGNDNDNPRAVGTIATSEWDSCDHPPGTTTACAPNNSIVSSQTMYCRFTTSTAALSQCVGQLGTGGSGAENFFRPFACVMGQTVAGATINSQSGLMCGRDTARAPYSNATAGTLFQAPPAAFAMLPRTASDTRKLRVGADLVVIFVTDAPEQSDAQAGTTDSIPTWVSYFNNYDGAGSKAFVGGIVCPNGSNCTDDNQNARFTTFLQQMGGIEAALPPDTDAQQSQKIGDAITQILRSSIAQSSPYVLTKAPISTSIKVAFDSTVTTRGACNLADVPRSRVNGFDFDGTTSSIQFFGNCRPTNDAGALGKPIAVSYRYWIEGSPNPDGNVVTDPCVLANKGPPFVSVGDQCVCPSTCGTVNGLASNQVCDTATCTATCQACPGGKVLDGATADPCDCKCDPAIIPPSGFSVDPSTCAFLCSTCSGTDPDGAGTKFNCNTSTCAFQCDNCGATPDSQHFCNNDFNVCALQCLPDCGGCGAGFQCNTTSCACECPADCGGPAPGAGFTCNRAACQYECRDVNGQPNCPGPKPSANATCNVNTCEWECTNCGGAEVGAGRYCDTNPSVCAVECLPDCGGCAPGLQCNTTACACECPADCGGPSPGDGFVCNRATCQYECRDANGQPNCPANAPHGPFSVCNAATCEWDCPGCVGGDVPSGNFCNTNPLVCDFECLPDCGGCTGAGVCNQTSCQCECPADCGGVAPIVGMQCNRASCRFECPTPLANVPQPGPNYTWDPVTCDWTCPSDCGSAPPGPNAVCDQSTCQYRCPADCGGCDGASTCNTATCACECPGDCGGVPPSPNFACDASTCSYTCKTQPTTPPPTAGGWTWDVTSCSYQCPADCGVGANLGPTEFCNRATCQVECKAGCGGCGFGEQCDTASCACQCVQDATCAAGFAWDVNSCSCACDTTQNCGPTRVLDPTTCSCVCHENANGVPDCNGCRGGGICQPSLCECTSIGG